MHKNIGRKPEGKRLLERPKHRWEDSIRMYLRQDGLVSSDIGQRPVVFSCEHGNEPLDSI